VLLIYPVQSGKSDHCHIWALSASMGGILNWTVSKLGDSKIHKLYSNPQSSEPALIETPLHCNINVTFRFVKECVLLK
jgi:hypothetical protein